MALKRKILEKDVEARLRDKAKLAGWSPYKFVSISRRSVPDQLILGSGDKVVAEIGRVLPDLSAAKTRLLAKILMQNVVTFVECKRPGEKPTPAQEREHAKLRERGFTVLVADNFEQIDEIYGGRGCPTTSEYH